MKHLEEHWDKLIISVFKGSNSAFYGSLLCSMEIKWDESVPTAAVNPDLGIKWNPKFFLGLPHETRKFVLLHEIEHVARLHMLRMGDRDFQLWNMACDYEINLAQFDDGLTYEGTEPLIDERFRGLTAEEIYTILEDEQDQDSDGSGGGSWGDGTMDMEPAEDGDSPAPTQEQAAAILNTVVKAKQSAVMQGQQAGMEAGVVDSILDKFLKPQVPWNNILRRYLIDKLHSRLTYRRPNRRYDEFYLPSRRKTDNGLAVMSFYLDTSGSISDEMVQIFNSEVRHVHNYFKPRELNLVQFDTDIRHEIKYKRGQRVSKMNVSGRGGTDLGCVYEHILKTKPNFVVILTDHFCPPMDKIKGVDILWVIFDNPHAEVNQGKICHVNTGS